MVCLYCTLENTLDFRVFCLFSLGFPILSHPLAFFTYQFTPSHVIQLHEESKASCSSWNPCVILTSREDIFWKVTKEHLSHASINTDIVVLDVIWNELRDKAYWESENI